MYTREMMLRDRLIRQEQEKEKEKLSKAKKERLSSFDDYEYKYLKIDKDEGRSKGEKEISFYLNKYNITCQREYWFPDLKLQKPLRFDFVIFSNNRLLFLLEYDGEQHFEEKSGFGDYEKVSISDRMKNEYYNEKGIPLFRISYKEKNNIESIIKGLLKKYDLI
ncbi:hypothetical protein J5Y03_12260 [Bacillus sp. RG28]|uniref:DUF2726 domain-containing protein n=1 Tax=Gottfriedia endophytica TaxID=2820819 RepID=A0A940SJE0_9BACI|nr:DUF2726 domain-containing protein [Gottfriedia endophytica]MBP0725945.1 hypothetical protein [Gottfriedia endophytica]